MKEMRQMSDEYILDDVVETFSDVEYCSSGEPGMNFCYYWKFK